MADFTALNFMQIIAPPGGGAPNAGNGQGNPLSGNVSAGSGLLSGAPTSPENSKAAIELFNLLLGKNNPLLKQENFASTGKNLPVTKESAVPVAEKTSPGTVDDSISALQSVLAGLLAQQSAANTEAANIASAVVTDNTADVVPVISSALDNAVKQILSNNAAPAEIISGQESQDTLIGGIQQLTQYNANKQVTAQTVAPAFSGNQDAAKLFQDLLNNMQKNNAPQTTVEASAVKTNPVPESVKTSALLQGKTLDAYRSTAALALPEVGSTLDTNDVDAVKNAFAQSQLLSSKNNIGSGNNTAFNLLQAQDTNPQTLAESIGRLKNLSAVTPLPTKIQVGQGEEGNKPLDQIAGLQAALTPVKPDNAKSIAKADILSAQANAANASTPQALAQTQQQNLSQQFDQKKQDNVVKLNTSSEQMDADNTQLTQSATYKAGVDAAKGMHDFANHLNKVVASPVDQVAMKIVQLPSGKQNITVQLEPAELGKVDVKLEWKPDGHAHILIAAERKETLDMLRNDMSTLQRSLADSGIKADASNLQFSLKGQEFAGQLAQQNQEKTGGNEQAQEVSDMELKQTIEDAAVAARYVNLNNLLDLRV